MKRIRSSALAACSFGLVTSVAVATQELATVTAIIENAPSETGNIDCALFSSPEGFPMNPAVATRQSIAASEIVRCEFRDLQSGVYALAASHDENTNAVTDTNLVGMPTEAWGVSNNARPFLRPPRFDEAAFEVTAGQRLTVTISLDK